MPLLRCTDEDCGHEFSVRTRLAIGSACEECGADTVEVGVDAVDAEKGRALR